MAIGLQTQTFVERRFIHTSVFLDTVTLKWYTRAPVPIGSYRNIVKVFSMNVWISFMLTLLLFSFLFYLTHSLYEQLDPDLIVPVSTKWDFLIFPFCKFVEPDPVPWFPAWSTGRALVLLWSVFSLIIVLAYSCNLRANLIAKDYEAPIKTHQDVLDRGENIYLPSAVQVVK